MNRIGFFAGVAFGLILAGARLHEYNTIHRMLRFEEWDTYLFMASAIAVSAPLLWFLDKRRFRTPLGGTLHLSRSRVERRHVLGSVVFGTGWALAGTCPAPALVMLGAGGLLGGVVMLGLFGGLMLREMAENRETVPARLSEQSMVPV